MSVESFNLLDSVPLGVFVIDDAYTVLFWNMTLEDWTDISRDRIVGTPIADFYPHLLSGRYTSRLEGIFKGGPPTIFSPQLHRYVIPIERPTGGHRTQQTTVTAIRDEEKNTYYAMFSIQDMTDLTDRIRDVRAMRDEALSEIQERRIVETRLKLSEGRYRALSEMISDFAFSFSRQPDGSYKREWITDAFTTITGYQADEFTSLDDWRRMIHEDDLDEAQRVFQTIERGHADEHLEHRIRTKSGETRYLQTFFRPVTDEEDKQVIRIYGAAQDITQRKAIEQQLRLSEQRFRQMAEVLDVVIYIADDITKKVYYVNPAYERVTGEHPNPFLQDANSYYPLMHREDRKNAQAALDKAAATASKVDTTYRIQQGDDSEKLRWIREQRFPMESPGPGKQRRYIGLMEDVTDQKEASEREFAMALEHEQINILSTFITDVTHEFRTPLSIINSSIYLLNKFDDPERREQYTTLIMEQVKSISDLVDVLVLMVSLDTGYSEKQEQVDVNGILKMILDQFKVRLRDSRHIVETEFYGAPLMVRGRPTHIWQAIVALVENAVRFTPDSGRIMLRSIKKDDKVHLEVEDTGVGIAPGDIDRIFDRFYRVDHAHSTRGLGLGLPIAKKVIERHQGSIEVISKVNQGSLFRVILPLTPPALDDNKSTSQVQDHLSSSK
jgi:PAS domain S-box-containing protein